MVYTGENNHYDVRLAGSLLKACENGTADFLNPPAVPYYTQDMITNQALNDAAQLQTLLNNASYGNQYINYAPTYIIQDSKTEWIKNIDKNDREIGCIIYKGKDENGNKHYEMMSPAGKINPGGIKESPMTQNPVPDIGIYRQEPSLDLRDPKGIEKYITGVIGNYFNAAFTKTPYFAPQWGAPETDMLSKAINDDPSMALRAAQKAYAQATSVKMENTVNHELNDNVREAISKGLPPFNTRKQNTIIGPVNGNDIPQNGVDFINAYYDGIKDKNSAAKTNKTQNGYVPYQTHEENPKNIDRFLVEEYGNIINASLTGKPYSGSIHHAQLKNLAAGIEAKMANNPAYMSGIVNQAQQNVLGFNYMPYNKDEFISRARDTSSSEFKLLDQIIANHVYDICKRNKQSFNGEFQELSKDLTEKLKNTDTAKTARKPSTRASAARSGTQSGTQSAADKGGNTSANAGAANETGKPSPGRSGAHSAANETKRPPTRTNAGHEPGRPPGRTGPAKKEETPPVSTSPEVKGERPSFVKEVSEFVKNKIVEKKPSLVLVDTFLGALVDKTKKIVRTGKTVAAAFVIATNLMAPHLQMTAADHLAKMSPPNAVTISVNQDDYKSAAHGTVKAGQQVQQKQQTRTNARAPARR
jgi:hypothetical protein